MSAVASQWDRTGKPFNPLLGETYELVRYTHTFKHTLLFCRSVYSASLFFTAVNREEQGFRLVSEQVSHHPPVSAFHAESLAGDFAFHGSIYPKLKFWGKSVEAEPKGTITLELHKSVHNTGWSNCVCVCVHITVFLVSLYFFMLFCYLFQAQ